MTDQHDTKPTIERIYDQVNKLSQRHTQNVWVAGRRVALPRAALLEQIRSAIYGDLGKTDSGKSAAAQERSVMDLGAFTLYEDITGRIEAYHRALTGRPRRETPEATLRAWFVAFDARYRKHQYTDEQMRRVLMQLKSFVSRIRGHFDQPRIKEIEGRCPQCGIERITAEDGATAPTLYASYFEGKAPTVKCRNPECDAEWAGDETLVQLGRHLGASVDEETLRTMGVLQ